jgi:hypothetical protein
VLTTLSVTVFLTVNEQSRSACLSARNNVFVQRPILLLHALSSPREMIFCSFKAGVSEARCRLGMLTLIVLENITTGLVDNKQTVDIPPCIKLHKDYDDFFPFNVDSTKCGDKIHNFVQKDENMKRNREIARNRKASSSITPWGHDP